MEDKDVKPNAEEHTDDNISNTDADKLNNKQRPTSPAEWEALREHMLKVYMGTA